MDFTRRLAHPEKNAPAYLEDLSCAYFLSDALFCACRMNLFELLKDGALSALEVSKRTGTDEKSMCRFLGLLEKMKLLISFESEGALLYANSTISQEYLIEKEGSLLADIRWRETLKGDWETLEAVLKAGRRTHFLKEPGTEEMEKRREDYLLAMDSVLAPKLEEILPMLPLERPVKILDLGCGSGLFSRAILKKSPAGSEAVLCDIPQMRPVIEKALQRAGMKEEAPITIHPINLLDEFWDLDGRFDLIILSNIVHAYDRESIGILSRAAELLSEDGILLIHDFFLEHDPLKSALSDINMMVNTYNGRAFTADEVTRHLKTSGLQTSGLVSLSGDTSVLFAAKRKEALDALLISEESRLVPKMLSLGFEEAIPIDPADVVLSPFSQVKCHFGCRSGGKKTCIPNDGMGAEKLSEMLSSYRKAYLLTGEPPTDVFQRACLEAEAEAFKSGFYKAFVFWAGPCSICPVCDPSLPCANTAKHRPSMEGSGMDVFKTASKAGVKLTPLRERGEFIRYIALLLLE